MGSAVGLGTSGGHSSSVRRGRCARVVGSGERSGLLRRVILAYIDKTILIIVMLTIIEQRHKGSFLWWSFGFVVGASRLIVDQRIFLFP